MREHGITTSHAQYWVHVCPLDATFYVYRRERMLKQLNKFRKREDKTFIGYLVPILANLRDNGGIIRPHYVGYDFIKEFDWDGETDAKVGKAGEQCFFKYCRQGNFLLPVIVKPYTEIKDQYMGKDFAARLPEIETDIEIKTDKPGGVWGTGNLFVQTHERQHVRSKG